MKLLSILYFLLCPVLLQAQAPQWEWAKSGEDVGLGFPNDIITDAAGNIYVTGAFNNTLTIGSLTVIAAGGTDAFIAKFDASGNILWLKSGGGLDNDKGIGIALDNGGNIYIEGEFDSVSTFETTTLTSIGLTDIFLTKYNSDGSLIWAKSWGSIYPEDAAKLCIDHQNNIYLTGNFSADGGSPVVYGTIDFDSYTLTSLGTSDIFLVKMDTSGTTQWARSAGGYSSEYTRNVSVDASGNIYVSGSTSSSTLTFSTLSLTNAKAFISKYNSSGDIQWVKGFNGSGAIYGCYNSADDAGNVYITGYSINVQTFNFGTVTVTGDESFVAKYNTDGSLVWAKPLGINSYDGGYSLAVDDDNEHLYVVGRYKLLGIFGNDTLQGYGADDILVTKFDSAGNHIWATRAGGSANDGVHAVTIDNSGSIYIAGYISSMNASFGSHSLSSSNSWDMFVAKLSQTTGITEEASINKKLSIYPTPANDAVYVKGVQQNTTYRITNLTGSNVQQGNLYKGINRIDITHLVKGMYLLYAGNEVHKMMKD